MYRCLSICIVVCGAIGCSKSPAPNQQLSVSASAAASDSARHVTSPLPQNPRDFGMLFQTEAANRPSGTIKTEDALAAFRKDGIPLDTVRQHLARPYGARYCVGGMSGTEIAFSVCEYIDAAAAQAGAETSRKIVLENREIRINQATSLTVREATKTPNADALEQRLFESFAKLK
jgi:hypothetical protein